MISAIGGLDHKNFRSVRANKSSLTAGVVVLTEFGLVCGKLNLTVESGRKNYLDWVRKLLTVSV